MRPNLPTYVTPAQAGVHERASESWIPACAGMTEHMVIPETDG
jgi:hypothetical protein